MRLLLFDVDGTLLLSGGAGSRALNRALFEFYGLSDAMQRVQVDGKTDPQIVLEALEALPRLMPEPESDGKLHPKFFGRYLELLREELDGSREQFVVLPGVDELIRSLSRDSRFALGVATGNIEAGARLKLDRAGLGPFFRFGGFGSDAENRTELIRRAIERGTDSVRPTTVRSAIVIGDTPRDIRHGREAGARVLAVATGNYSIEELRSHEPEWAVESLDPIQPVLDLFNQEM